MKLEKSHLSAILMSIPVFATAASFYILATVNSANADHDKDDKSHPALIQAVASNKAAMDLLAQKVELGQQSNEKDHERQEKTMERQEKSMERVTEMLVTIVDRLP